MYYPYLRSKQYEMLALKDLLPLIGKKRDKISPIIEPVNDGTSFKGILKAFKEDDLNFSLIINPAVGDWVEDIDILIDVLEKELETFENYQVGILINNSDINYYRNLVEKLKLSKLKNNGYSLIHNMVLGNIEDILSVFTSHKPIVNNIIDLSKTNTDRLYKDKFSLGTQVCLDDYFKSQSRNADYLKVSTSLFSKDYDIYEDQGFKGFGDFLTIGDNYSETGYSPYAVAIHISYKEDDNIYVRHFVSDSNTDTSDVAGKFLEANTKLNDWLSSAKIPTTQGIEGYQILYATKHYSGLGINKKYSIMNHIELIMLNI